MVLVGGVLPQAATSADSSRLKIKDSGSRAYWSPRASKKYAPTVPPPRAHRAHPTTIPPAPGSTSYLLRRASATAPRPLPGPGQHSPPAQPSALVGSDL